MTPDPDPFYWVGAPIQRRSSNIMDKLTPYLKAFFGFITPGAVVLGSAVTEASVGGEHVTQGEWITVLLACVLTGSLVFGVPNRDPRALHQDESVQPPSQRGESILYIALVVVVVLVAIWLLSLLIR